MVRVLLGGGIQGKIYISWPKQDEIIEEAEIIKESMLHDWRLTDHNWDMDIGFIVLVFCQLLDTVHTFWHSHKYHMGRYSTFSSWACLCIFKRWEDEATLKHISQFTFLLFTFLGGLTVDSRLCHFLVCSFKFSGFRAT